MVVPYKFSQMHSTLLLSLILATTTLAALIKRDCSSGESCSVLELWPGGAKCCGERIVKCENDMILHVHGCGFFDVCIGHGSTGARCESA